MNPVIDKIQKLLRLASNNTSQAEMESAMAKAIELATLNNIELSSICLLYTSDAADEAYDV